MRTRRSILRRIIKKAEYAALGLTMVTFIYAAMILTASTSKPQKEWI